MQELLQRDCSTLRREVIDPAVEEHSYITKCAKDICSPKAIDKNGKPLAGAAKASFLKKCEAEA